MKHPDAPCMVVSPKGALVTLLVQPKSGRNAFSGLHDDALKVQLTAPPVQGAANRALIEFLSKKWKIPKKALELVHGAKSRRKVVRVLLPPEEVAGLVRSSLAEENGG